jgi:hypothetical protein
MLSGEVTGTYEDARWTLNGGEGVRTFIVRQTFPNPFPRAPIVVVSFSYLDAAAGPLRARVYASDIDANGFNVNFETWADSRLNAAVAAWIAYEP